MTRKLMRMRSRSHPSWRHVQSGILLVVCVAVLLPGCTRRRRPYRTVEAPSSVAVRREIERSWRPTPTYPVQRSQAPRPAASTARAYRPPQPEVRKSPPRKPPRKRPRKRRATAVSAAEQKRLTTALQCSNGDYDEAAQLLGISRKTLEQRLNQSLAPAKGAGGP